MKKVFAVILTMVLAIGLTIPASAYTLYDSTSTGWTKTRSREFTESALTSVRPTFIYEVVAHDTQLYAVKSGNTELSNAVQVGEIKAGEVVKGYSIEEMGGDIVQAAIKTSSGNYATFESFTNSSGTTAEGYYIKSADLAHPEYLMKQFTVDENTYRITKMALENGVVGIGEVMYTATDTYKTYNVNIPDTVNYAGLTYKVTSIAPSTMVGKLINRQGVVKSVTIGANVTRIGDYAFYGVKKLKSVTFNGCSIPVSQYGKGVFSGTSPKVYFNNVSNATALKAKFLKSKKTTSDQPYANGSLIKIKRGYAYIIASSTQSTNAWQKTLINNYRAILVPKYNKLVSVKGADNLKGYTFAVADTYY